MTKMTQRIMLMVLLLHGTWLSISAQKVAPAETNDPKAKALLDKLKSKYEAYKTVTASLTVTFKNGDTKESQQGKVLISGDKYRFEMKNQNVICDGKTVWVHQKNNNELQINDADANEDEVFSPNKLFKIYETASRVMYSLVGEFSQGGKTIQQIEFKPKERDKEEFVKMRISIDKNATMLTKVEVFGKDGSNYTISISKVTPNTPIDSGQFTFNEAAFTGTKVDLR